jgi:hypothetical protein
VTRADRISALVASLGYDDTYTGEVCGHRLVVRNAKRERVRSYTRRQLDELGDDPNVVNEFAARTMPAEPEKPSG